MNSHFRANMQTHIAGADLSAKQFHFVKFGAAEDTVIACSVNDEKAIGVLMNAPASGERAEVALFGGGALLKLAATITRGDLVATNTNGEGKAVAAAGYANAEAMQSGVSGDVIAVMLVKFQMNP